MNVTILGGGAWGTTLAQALADNNHSVLIRDVNQGFIDKINNEHVHPLFDVTIPSTIRATFNLEEALDFSEVIVLCIPTKFMRTALEEVNALGKSHKVFVNVSKGIEPSTGKCVSQIVDQVLDDPIGYVVLSGPSHAEEMIFRKFTSLVSASKNEELAIKVQTLFSNDRYLRVYTSTDVIGVEAGGAIKNAIAVVSGIASGLGLGENARAALITRGMREVMQISIALGGEKETAFGLSGLGDLIVTASSLNSRNFQAGLKIGQGQSIDYILKNAKQTVEGIRTIEAAYFLGQKYNLYLPIMDTAYELVSGKIDVDTACKKLLQRELKSE